MSASRFDETRPSYQATERPAPVLRYQLWHQPPGELGHRKIDTYSTLREACAAAGHPDHRDWMWASGGLVVTPELRDPARGKWLISGEYAWPRDRARHAVEAALPPARTLAPAVKFRAEAFRQGEIG